MVSVRQVLVALMQSCDDDDESCDGCERWVNKKCSGIKGRLLPDSVFMCARCLGTARAIDERQSLEVEVGNEKLEVVPEF